MHELLLMFAADLLQMACHWGCCLRSAFAQEVARGDMPHSYLLVVIFVLRLSPGFCSAPDREEWPLRFRPEGDFLKFKVTLLLYRGSG